MNRRSFLKLAALSPILTVFPKAQGEFRKSEEMKLKTSQFERKSIFEILRLDQEKPRLILIGSKPGEGKTFVLTNLISAIRKDTKFNSICYDYENDSESLVIQLLSVESGIPYDDLVNCNFNLTNIDRFNTGYKSLAQSRIFFSDTKLYTIEEIRRNTESQLQKHPDTKYVFIDYLQLLQTENNFPDRKTQVQAVLGELKQLAIDYNLQVIVASQLNSPLPNNALASVSLENIREVTDHSQIDEILLVRQFDSVDSQTNGKIISFHHYGSERKRQTWYGNINVTTHQISKPTRLKYT